LETYVSDLERELREWRIAINVLKSSVLLFAKAARLILKPQQFHMFGDPIQWVILAHYLGVALDTRLTWLTRIDQVRNKATQRLGVLGPLLYRRSLSIRNGVMLYQQLIRPMMDYACPVWRSAARSRIRKRQVLKSKCLRIATIAPWYTGNNKLTMIFESLSLPTTSDL
jgi:hypothetical protein